MEQSLRLQNSEGVVTVTMNKLIRMVYLRHLHLCFTLVLTRVLQAPTTKSQRLTIRRADSPKHNDIVAEDGIMKTNLPLD